MRNIIEHHRDSMAMIKSLVKRMMGVAAMVVINFSIAQAQTITLQDSLTDTTGTNSSSFTGGSISLNSTPFSVSSASDLLVVEMSTRDTNSPPTDILLPSSITYSGLTLNAAVNQDSTLAGSPERNVAIYYTFLTPGTTYTNQYFNGSIPASESYYSISAYAFSGVSTSIAPTTAFQDSGTSTTNTLTVAVQNNSLAFVMAAGAGPTVGGTANSPVSIGLTVQDNNSPNPSVGQSSVTSVVDAGGGPTTFLSGYVTGLSSTNGMDNFTATATLGSGYTINRFPFAVITFDQVPEPPTYLLLLGALGWLIGWSVCAKFGLRMHIPRKITGLIVLDRS